MTKWQLKKWPADPPPTAPLTPLSLPTHRTALRRQRAWESPQHLQGVCEGRNRRSVNLRARQGEGTHIFNYSHSLRITAHRPPGPHLSCMRPRPHRAAASCRAAPPAVARRRAVGLLQTATHHPFPAAHPRPSASRVAARRSVSTGASSTSAASVAVHRFASTSGKRVCASGVRPSSRASTVSRRGR